MKFRHKYRPQIFAQQISTYQFFRSVFKMADLATEVFLPYLETFLAYNLICGYQKRTSVNKKIYLPIGSMSHS